MRPQGGMGYSIFARVENKNGCYQIAQINLLVIKALKLESTYQKTLIKCDDNANGIQTFDLSEIKKEIEGKFAQKITVTFYEKTTGGNNQAITNIKSYQNKTPNQQKLSVRIDNGHCSYTGEHVTLRVVKHNTAFNVTASEKRICNNKPVTLSITNMVNVKHYKWVDENNVEIGTQKSIQINKKGTYKAIVTTNTNCNIEKTFNIELARPIPISIKNLNVHYENESNILSVDADMGRYLFALDGDKDYTEYPEFRNIAAGEHTLYIREKNNTCSLKTIVFNTIKIDKYFSPNGDGINDYWKIRGIDADFHKNSYIIIMNRDGIIFYDGPLLKDGWDGKDGNGKDLPRGNYWYKVRLTNGSKKIQEIVGSIALLR